MGNLSVECQRTCGRCPADRPPLFHNGCSGNGGDGGENGMKNSDSDGHGSHGGETSAHTDMSAHKTSTTATINPTESEASAHTDLSAHKANAAAALNPALLPMCMFGVHMLA